MSTYNPSATAIINLYYTYNAASQVTTAYENARTANFTNDNIGQLIQEQHTTVGVTMGYTYDANGNRLSKTRTGQTAESYTYDAGDKLTAITGGVDSRTFTYDAAGRTTSIVRGSGTTSFAYDYESRVTSITRPGSLVDSFTYNGLDARVGQTGAYGSKTFKRSGITATSPVLSDGLAQYTPGISEKRGAVTKYDHHGLKNAMRQNQHGGVFTAYKLTDAFGHETLWSGGTWTGPFQYGGQFGYQTDTDNLRLLGHRYYDASTGRFLTRDPIKDGRNWYGYCENNPVSGFDSTGLTRTDLAQGAALVAEETPGMASAWYARMPEVLKWLARLGTAGPAVAATPTASNRITVLAEKMPRIPPQAGETAQRYGQRMHQMFRHLENGINRFADRTIRGSSQRLRPDLVDYEAKVVYELKPDNVRAILQGQRQLEKYLNELERLHGGGWRGVIVTYYLRGLTSTERFQGIWRPNDSLFRGE